MTIWTLVVFAAFGALCIFWLGNVTNTQRRTVEKTLDALLSTVSDLRNYILHQPPAEQLPDYIPWGDGTGGFYKQPDGSWRADSPIRRDGHSGQTTTADVEGSMAGISGDIELDEE